ncbi:hypothetical protein FPOA_02528 [Fusarium poae]|uniref:Uncharacterized protein n=1 Tax=Fusarium poae TaxID=36050 RepID=A0A1B8B794_FUSPO|nr:hypothetical protein FPOA_02528 [Fusarium poae]
MFNQRDADCNIPHTVLAMENKHNDLDASKHGGNAGDLIGIYNEDSEEVEVIIPDENSHAFIRFFNRPAVGEKQWTRTDAIRYLKCEFWLLGPRKEGQPPPKNLDEVHIGKDHPFYGLYLELYILIHKHYDEVSASAQQMIASDNSTTREARNALAKAADARHNGDHHWQTLLPLPAEMMVSRFIHPYNALDETVATLASQLNVLHLLCITRM